MKKVLSIDGGGIRGIIPGQVMISLEDKIQRITGNPSARLAEYFDFFAGTSTGGILNSIYLCPEASNPAKARFSAREAVDLYILHGEEIFTSNFIRKISSLFGVIDEKYSAKALERWLLYYFKDIKLSQLLKPCLITAYDIERRRAHFFRQHDAKIAGDANDFFIRDVCRATAAAPTYFQAVDVRALNNERYPLIDGGVYMNNPALGAYSEVRSALEKPIAKDMFIVSLGTGDVSKPYPFQEAKNYGALKWARPLIDIMMSGAAEVTHFHLTKMYDAVGRQDQYKRIQPDDMADVNPAMDAASSANIRALVALGIDTAQKADAMLEEVAEIVINDAKEELLFV